MITAQLCAIVEFGEKLPSFITLEIDIGEIEKEIQYEPNNY